MRILEVQDRTPELIEKLLRVWEDSVRATHLFLSDGEIINIREYVPLALTGIAHLIIAEDDAGEAVAFMGIQEGSLEMLFIENAQRGKGLGRKLLEYGIEKHAVERLAVNGYGGARLVPRKRVSVITAVLEAGADTGGMVLLFVLCRALAEVYCRVHT